MAQKSEKKYPLSSSDYKICEEVGQGVSAIVYRAFCIPFNETVAIKVLDLEKCNGDLDEIRREAQTLSLICHPNLSRAHCSFVANQNLWVVMPYMAGGSCLHIMKSVYPEGFEEVIIATILRDVLKALEYLHNHGHIHRDVKAGNILVDESGAIKLGDFGVSACMFDTGDRQRSRITFAGTPCWMAPEVMEQLHGYNFKADIWSFGITALELAHGNAPFSKYPPMKVLLMTLQNAPPGLDYERDKRFSKSFKEMIAMCLVKDPTKRPSAQRLLKHSFFKNARSNEYVARTLLDDLPPLGDRLRALKLKEADRLVQKKMPYGEKEERSQNEYKRAISAWNFDLEDLKAQAALIQDYNELPAAKVELEPQKPTKRSEDSKGAPSSFQSPINIHSLRVETLEKDGDHVMRVQPGPKPYFPLQCLNGLKGRFDVFEDDIHCESPTWRECTNSEFCRAQEMQIYKGNAENVRNYEQKQNFHEDSNPAPMRGRKVFSGPLVPEHILASYRLRTGDASRDKPQSRLQHERNFSGPLISHVASDIRSMDSFLGSPKSSAYSLEEKSKGLVVQQKGRFKVTSEDVDLEVVIPSSSPQRTQGLQTSSQSTSMHQSSPKSSGNTSCIAVSSVLPQLQSILHQNTMQRDQIATVMKYMSQGEALSAYCPTNLASKTVSHGGAENYMFETSSNRERELLLQITELQSSMENLVDELQKSKLKNIQLERQLNAVFNKEEEERIRREDIARDIG